jgi:phosphohistidine swiveling domain-containing protein
LSGKRQVGYRQMHRVSQQNLGLAVVVQCMVQSEVSGVLFTADPVSGQRDRTIIDAAYGLGEALVSGQVTPDQYIVDTDTGTIVEKSLGSKLVRITGKPGGGIQQDQVDASNNQALVDAAILELAKLGKNVEELYGQPQDIEWGFAAGKFYLLQTRAITSLFPLPDDLPDNRLRMLFSFGALQGMLDPMTPLGLDLWRLVIAGGARLCGIKNTTEENQQALRTAGERLWIDITPMLGHPFGKKVLPIVFEFVEPTIGQAFNQVNEFPPPQPGKKETHFRSYWQLLNFGLPIFGNVILNNIWPENRVKGIQIQTENILKVLQTKTDESPAGFEGVRQTSAILREIPAVFITMFRRVVTCLVAGMMNFQIAYQLSKRIPTPNEPNAIKSSDLALMLTRGVPNNETTSMDLNLWQTARQIQQDDASLVAFQTRTPESLVVAYRQGRLPVIAQKAISYFLERYGLRGLAEIDIGRSRWMEEPGNIINNLQNYIQITDLAKAPDVVFAASARSRENALEELIRRAQKTHFGFLKAYILRITSRRITALIGSRESPKFFLVRYNGILRQKLLSLGKELLANGTLTNPDDLFFLKVRELERFGASEKQDWISIIQKRRDIYQRELQRKQIPRLMLSNGRAFYEGMDSPLGADINSIYGRPVSPGTAEGPVRVVLSPVGANLEPGDIMVCPGTDPSWTPLFLSAGALIMEVGGMMTHGAVVAREYGIPAVVGVHQATTQLQSGQRVRVNGSTGEITRL